MQSLRKIRTGYRGGSVLDHRCGSWNLTKLECVGRFTFVEWHNCLKIWATVRRSFIKMSSTLFWWCKFNMPTAWYSWIDMTAFLPPFKRLAFWPPGGSEIALLNVDFLSGDKVNCTLGSYIRYTLILDEDPFKTLQFIQCLETFEQCIKIIGSCTSWP